MNACEVIKDSEHCVKHDDNLHAITLATDVEKSWDVVEHYGHLFENLNRKETRVWFFYFIKTIRYAKNCAVNLLKSQPGFNLWNYVWTSRE